MFLVYFHSKVSGTVVWKQSFYAPSPFHLSYNVFIFFKVTIPPPSSCLLSSYCHQEKYTKKTNWLLCILIITAHTRYAIHYIYQCKKNNQNLIITVNHIFKNVRSISKDKDRRFFIIRFGHKNYEIMFQHNESRQITYFMGIDYYSLWKRQNKAEKGKHQIIGS